MAGSATKQALSTPQKVVDLCGYASAALEKASEVVDRHEKRAAAVAQLAPKVAQALVENQRIYPSQVKEAVAQLQDPVRCLEILLKVAGHRNDEELAKLGQPVDGNGNTKTASANGRSSFNSLTSPHVGAKTSMVKQSDINLFTRLGLNPPTE
jgi:hypothetical protein